MTLVSLLDTGPLGLLSHPKGGIDARDCKAWLRRMLADGARVVVPDISEYELRRELPRGDKTGGLSRLDALTVELGYLPIDDVVLHNAARIWAEARKAGKPTAPDLALDGDCILAAQTRTAYKLLTHDEVVRGFRIVIATTNEKHLNRFATAKRWQDISVASF